jgi:hypothetical protein
MLNLLAYSRGQLLVLSISKVKCNSVDEIVQHLVHSTLCALCQWVDEIDPRTHTIQKGKSLLKMIFHRTRAIDVQWQSKEGAS